MPVLASSYKPSTDWYWQVSTSEELSSSYSASTGAVLITSTKPVFGSTGVVSRPL